MDVSEKTNGYDQPSWPTAHLGMHESAECKSWHRVSLSANMRTTIKQPIYGMQPNRQPKDNSKRDFLLLRICLSPQIQYNMLQHDQRCAQAAGGTQKDYSEVWRAQRPKIWFSYEAADFWISAPMRTTVEPSCRRERRKKAAKSERFLSTSEVSLVRRLMMRPRGVVWKKLMGALRTGLNVHVFAHALDEN